MQEIECDLRKYEFPLTGRRLEKLKLNQFEIQMVKTNATHNSNKTIKYQT